jgi:hypothetical protein
LCVQRAQMILLHSHVLLTRLRLIKKLSFSCSKVSFHALGLDAQLTITPSIEIPQLTRTKHKFHCDSFII